MAKYRKNLKMIILFLFPAFIVYTIFEVIPVIGSFYFSFQDWPGIQGVPLKFVGLKNFITLFTYKEFIQSLKNVMVYVFLSVLTQVPIGFLLALVLSKLKRGVRFFKAAFFIPMVLPATATALLWGFIFFPNELGVLNNFLRTIGLGNLARTWLVDDKVALGCILVVTTWSSVGYYMIIGMAAIAGVPEDVIESGIMDGATGLKNVFYIMLPMIWESIKISVVMVITGVLKIFDLIFIMTPGGGPGGATQVPALMMYNEAFKYNHYGVGSAISTVIFVISISFSLISLKLMSRERVEY